MTASTRRRSANLQISLRPGAFIGHGSHSTTAIAYGVTIEKAIGGSAGDTLIGNDADNVPDGGTGSGTAVCTGYLSSYSLTRTAGGYTVQDKSGTDGTDTLSGIERLQFADMSVNLTVAANAASISGSQGMAIAAAVTATGTTAAIELIGLPADFGTV